MNSRRVLPLLMFLGAGCTSTPPAAYDARGTVEVPEIDLGAMSAARVIAIRVEEGAAVQSGDTVALLSQIEMSATLAGQGARVAAASANLRDLESGSRPEEVRRAEAEVGAASAELERATRELGRIRELASRDVLSRQTFDDAVTADRVARARLSASEEAVRLLKAGTRPERIAAGRADLANARAALAQIEARAADLVLVTPVAGIVLSRNAEPGEGLAPNVPVVTIGETARPYVRVFVPQSRVTGLAVGSAAEVVTEDGRTMAGRVVAINPKAEYTPRVALSEQERADLMFGVKVEFANPAEAPHPGLWVTVRLGRTGDSVR